MSDGRLYLLTSTDYVDELSQYTGHPVDVCELAITEYLEWIRTGRQRLAEKLPDGRWRLLRFEFMQRVRATLRKLAIVEIGTDDDHGAVRP